MKTLDEQISVLEQRLQLMKFKRRSDLAKTYAFVVGSCLKLNHCTYHMITAIKEVKELKFNDPEIKDDKEFHYECIQVIWNPREKDEHRTAEISTHMAGRIDSSRMPQFSIPYPKFAKALTDCCEWITKTAKDANTAKVQNKDPFNKNNKLNE